MKTRAPLLLISLFLLSAAAFGGDSREGFYVRLGLGPSWFEEIKQEREMPDFPALPYGSPEMNRYQRLNVEEGGLGEASVGYSFGNQRFELMFSGAQANLWSDGGVVYYEGAPLADSNSDSPYEHNSDSPPYEHNSDSPPYEHNSDSPPYGYGNWSSYTYFEDLTIHTLSLNFYYDFPSKRSRVVPYLGYGAGAAFVDIPGRQHVSWNGPWYGDEPTPEPMPTEPPYDDNGNDSGNSSEGDGSGDNGGDYRDDPPPTQPGWPTPYYADRAIDLSGASFMSAFYGGVEYRIVSDLYLGFRLGYVYIGDVETEDERYDDRFPFGGFRGGRDMEISGLSHWSAVLTLRLLRL